eukprot:g18516.t1
MTTWDGLADGRRVSMWLVAHEVISEPTRNPGHSLPYSRIEVVKMLCQALTEPPRRGTDVILSSKPGEIDETILAKMFFEEDALHEPGTVRPFRTQLGARVRIEYVSGTTGALVLPDDIVIEQYLYPTMVGTHGVDGRIVLTPTYYLPQGSHIMRVRNISSAGNPTTDKRKMLHLEPGAADGLFSELTSDEDLSCFSVILQGADSLVQNAQPGEYCIGNLLWRRIYKSGKHALSTTLSLLRKTIGGPRSFCLHEDTTTPARPPDVEPQGDSAGGLAALGIRSREELENIIVAKCQSTMAPVIRDVEQLKDGMQGLAERHERLEQKQDQQFAAVNAKFDDLKEHSTAEAKKNNSEILGGVERMLKSLNISGPTESGPTNAEIIASRAFKRATRNSPKEWTGAHLAGLVTPTDAEGPAIHWANEKCGTFHINKEGQITKFEENDDQTDSEDEEQTKKPSVPGEEKPGGAGGDLPSGPSGPVGAYTGYGGQLAVVGLEAGAPASRLDQEHEPGLDEHGNAEMQPASQPNGTAEMQLASQPNGLPTSTQQSNASMRPASQVDGLPEADEGELSNLYAGIQQQLNGMKVDGGRVGGQEGIEE